MSNDYAFKRNNELQFLKESTSKISLSKFVYVPHSPLPLSKKSGKLKISASLILYNATLNYWRLCDHAFRHHIVSYESDLKCYLHLHL